MAANAPADRWARRRTPLRAYLPAQLARRVAAGGLPPVPNADVIDAALLLTDISGFTTLTERLQRRGREGAEEIAALVDRVFAPAIRAIERHGGDIATFGGDALFSLFPTVTSAVHAATAISSALARLGPLETSVGRVTIDVAQVVHAGRVRGMHLGSEKQRHYLLAGPTICAIARMEESASRGDILISASARRSRRTTSRAAGAERAAGPVAPAGLARYVDGRLLPLLGRGTGCYRAVALLFVESRGTALRHIQSIHASMARAMSELDGILLKSDVSPVGVRFMCLFGVPRAHGDDADRAIEAARRLLAGCPKGTALRCGIHAGVVANLEIGTAARRSFEVMGDVVNVAARTMAAAPWGTAMTTDATRALLRGATTRSRGRRHVKGRGEAVGMHVVTGVPRARAHPTKPMFGRRAALARIVAALGAARRGRGATMAVVGEAGVGKSRLGLEVAAAARGLSMRIHEGAAPAFGGAPHAAITALLRDAVGASADASSASLRARVGRAVARLDLPEGHGPAICRAVGVAMAGATGAMDSRAARAHAVHAIVELLTAQARTHPRVLVLDDVQWADELTREVAAALAEVARREPLVLLLLHRPGYDPPAAARLVRVGGLSRADTARVVRRLLPHAAPRTVRLVAERSGGNPFFAEELARHIGELPSVAAGSLPTSIEAVVAARLDALSPAARLVAQYGAVIGRRFPVGWLERVGGLAHAVRAGVAELAMRGLVLVVGGQDLLFSQALVRDVAYASILSTERRRMHRSVARALESVADPSQGELAAALGHHWEHAGDRRRAATCYRGGAQHALALFSMSEAERLLRRFLELRPSATRDTVTARTELAVKVLRNGGRPREARAELEEALAQAEALHDHELTATCLTHLAELALDGGHPDEASQMLSTAMEHARAGEDRSVQGSILDGMAAGAERAGDSAAAEAHYREALAIAEAANLPHEVARVTGNLGSLLQDLGRLDEARGLHEKALGYARANRNRRGEAVRLANLALIHERQGRLDEGLACHDEATRIAREIGDRRIEGPITVNMANTLGTLGRTREARRAYMRALRVSRQTGDRRVEVASLGSLSLLERQLGNHDEARARNDEAMRIADRTGNTAQLALWTAHGALIEVEQGRIEQARETFRTVARRLRRQTMPRLEAQVLGHLAGAELTLGRMRSFRGTHRRAAGMARASGDPKLIGGLLLTAIRAELVTQSRPAALDRLLADAESALTTAREERGLVELLCLRGEALLARGGSPRGVLAEARRRATAIGAGPRSQLRRHIAIVARAQRALAAGEALVGGRRTTDVEPGLLAWIRGRRE